MIVYLDHGILLPRSYMRLCLVKLEQVFGFTIMLRNNDLQFY